jgi:superfamily II DNA helicase RecQ
VKLICVDEVHLICEWGGSFRSAFDRVAELRQLFPLAPALFLSATLTPSSESQLQQKLSTRELVSIKGKLVDQI